MLVNFMHSGEKLLSTVEVGVITGEKDLIQRMKRPKTLQFGKRVLNPGLKLGLLPRGTNGEKGTGMLQDILNSFLRGYCTSYQK